MAESVHVPIQKIVVFCRLAGIPSRIVSGYAKAHGYEQGEDVTLDKHNAHAWNLVYVDNDWFPLDVTWGAGFIKSKEKTYATRFNDSYFLTDPDVFISDHFPYPVNSLSKHESSEDYQLLRQPVSLQDFCCMVNFEQYGKMWGIRAVTHSQAVVYNVELETDIVLEETHTEMNDYIGFLYDNDRKLDNCVYTFILTAGRVNVHVCIPYISVFKLIIYGRRMRDGPSADFQPIVRYTLQGTKACARPYPYPTHHTLYGPTNHLKQYGIECMETHAYHQSENGEIIFTLRNRHGSDIYPRVFYQSSASDLKDLCFIDHTEDGDHMNVIVRMEFEGHYKLVLFVKPHDSFKYVPFATYLIHCKTGCQDGPFPFAHSNAHKYKCCLIEPLTRHVPANSEHIFCMKSQLLQSVRCEGTTFTASLDGTFDARVPTSKPNTKLTIEGCGDDDIFHALYTFDVH